MTGKITVSGEKADQTSGLADGSIAGGTFQGYPGTAATSYVKVQIPFTAAQYAASESGNIAVQQTNPAFDGIDSWVGSVSGVKDKLYSVSASSSGFDEVVFNNGTDETEGGYFILYVPVADVEGDIVIKVAFAATQTIGAGEEVDITITIENDVTFN